MLDYASSIGPGTELGLFILAWTGVKVFCFDAGGVVLALASGILFGGVWQGAVVSAFSATVGSSVAFFLAKLDTPVRKKALEVVNEYPSLRGIEKVGKSYGFKHCYDCSGIFSNFLMPPPPRHHPPPGPPEGPRDPNTAPKVEGVGV